jgi:hypothetical protein
MPAKDVTEVAAELPLTLASAERPATEQVLAVRPAVTQASAQTGFTQAFCRGGRLA